MGERYRLRASDATAHRSRARLSHYLIHHRVGVPKGAVGRVLRGETKSLTHVMYPAGRRQGGLYTIDRGSGPPRAAGLEATTSGCAGIMASMPFAETLGYAKRLHWASLDPPIIETFAIIVRDPIRLSSSPDQNRTREAAHPCASG